MSRGTAGCTEYSEVYSATAGLVRLPVQATVPVTRKGSSPLGDATIDCKTVLMSRNAVRATACFRRRPEPARELEPPTERVVELSVRAER